MGDGVWLVLDDVGNFGVAEVKPCLRKLVKRVELVPLRYQGLFFAALVLTQIFCQTAGLKITTGWFLSAYNPSLRLCEQMVGLEPSKFGEKDRSCISQPSLLDGQAEAKV